MEVDIALVATVVGCGVAGIAEGFISGCSGGVSGTAIDLAVDAATLYAEGGASAACATAEATTISYNVCKTVGRVAGAAFSCTPYGKGVQGVMGSANMALSAGKTAKTAAQVSTAAAKAKTASNVPKMQKVGKIGLESEKAAASFTKNNARANLAKLTGISPGNDVHAHHVFPQRYRNEFIRREINIDSPKYLTWWEKKDHLRQATNYNRLWKEIWLCSIFRPSQAVKFWLNLTSKGPI